MQVDPFVDFMLQYRHAEASGKGSKKLLKDACRWLSLYNNCRKLLSLPRSQVLAHDGAGAPRATYSFRYIIILTEQPAQSRSDSANHILLNRDELTRGGALLAFCKPTGRVPTTLLQQLGRASRLGVCTLATDAEGACVAVADEEDKTWSQTVDVVAQRSGFHTPEALDFFVNKYCTVVSSADRRTVKRSDEQLQLLQVTCMVCAVRSNGNVVDGGAMGTALLQSFNQLSPKEVRPFSADPREIVLVDVSLASYRSAWEHSAPVVLSSAEALLQPLQWPVRVDHSFVCR